MEIFAKEMIWIAKIRVSPPREINSEGLGDNTVRDRHIDQMCNTYKVRDHLTALHRIFSL